MSEWIRTVLALCTGAGLMISFNADLHAEEGGIALTPCFVAGARVSGQCGLIDLPLDYNDLQGPTIAVHVTVLRTKSASRRSDPIVLLAGGPGQASGEQAQLASLIFRGASRTRDILLVDARGTGKSTPMQCWPEDDEVMLDEELFAEFLHSCRDRFEFDVRHINLETITRDLEEVRQKLGYGQLNLYGASYGTRVAAHYIRRYGKNVRSAIVDGVLPSDISLFETVPASTERAKQKLVEDCQNSPACANRYPTLEADIEALMAKAIAGELIYDGENPLTGEHVSFPLDYGAAVESLRGSFYNADNTIILPFAVEQALKGNLSPLVAGLFNSTAIANGMYLGMTLSVLCGEEVARISPQAAEEAGRTSFAADTYYETWAGNCKNWDYFTVGKELPADIHAPLVSNVPTLALSGDLDPITPPAFGQHWVNGVENARHITVKGTGHITSYVGCMPELITDFINDLDVAALDTECLTHFKRLPVVTGLNGQVR